MTARKAVRTNSKTTRTGMSGAFLLGVILVSVIVLVLFSQSATGATTISVKVQNDENEPAKDVHVVIKGPGGKFKGDTTEEGIFSPNVGVGGKYTVRIEEEGYKPDTTIVTIGDNETKQVILTYEKEEWTTTLNRALEDDVLQIIGLGGILCLIISLPLSTSMKKTRKIEDTIPDILTEVAANIRSANSVESSFRDVAAVRTDYSGRLLKITCERMNQTSFSQAMQEFGLKTKSVAVQRIVSLINIAIESGASIADVLEKISEELFSIYSLRQDRENKSGTNASVILWGGVLFTPGIIGFILGFFNAGAGIDLGQAPDIIQSFLIFFAVECAFMHAVAMGSMKVDMIRTPFYMFLAQLIYVMALYGSPAVMG